MAVAAPDRSRTELTISRHRWRCARPFVTMSAIAVVAGGLVAAVTGPLELANGSWAAAYLVLVVGVAQLSLAAGRVWLPEHLVVSRRRVVAELAAWNVGSLAVLAGTITGSVWLVGAGSVGLLVALGSWAQAGWRPRTGQRWWGHGYLLLLAFLIISVVVGTALSVVRHT